MSRAVSSNSLVSRLVFALTFLAFVAMSHLNQGSVFEGSFDLLVAGAQERSRNLPEGDQFCITDVFTFVLGEAEQKDGSMRAEPDEQSKAGSLALSRPRNALLDDPSAEIGIDQALLRTLDRRNQARIRDAILAGESRKRSGFEDTHECPYSAINYSLWNYIARDDLKED
jgi:hypothetical protein